MFTLPHTDSFNGRLDLSTVMAAIKACVPKVLKGKTEETQFGHVHMYGLLALIDFANTSSVQLAWATSLQTSQTHSYKSK